MMELEDGVRDALALVLAWQRDREAAIAMAAQLSEDELSTLLVAFLALVPLARTVAVGEPLEDWCESLTWASREW